MKSQLLGVLLALAGPAAPLMAQQAAESGQVAATPPAEQQAAAPAVAQAAPQATTAGAEKARKDGKICKLTEVTGSRFKSRLCYTQQEWEAIDRAHKDKMREIDSQPIRQRSEGG